MLCFCYRCGWPLLHCVCYIRTTLSACRPASGTAPANTSQPGYVRATDRVGGVSGGVA